MMRLSPRLICFIGASSVLLRSALAAREDSSPDVVVTKSKTKSKAFKDLVWKINKDVGADKSFHAVGHSRMLMACDDSGESGVILRVFENGLRTISSAKDADDMCNITDIEYQCTPNGVGKLQQQLVVTGTKCRKTYGQNASGEDYMYYTFEKFHSTMTFNVEECRKNVEELKNHFVTACEFKIGKFKMVKTKKIKMEDGLYNAIPYSRQDKSIEEGGHYILDTKPSTMNKMFGFVKKQQVFKRAEMMLCRNEEGKPVAVWDFGKKNKKCQWIELRDCFSFLKYQDDKGRFVDHPHSEKVMKEYSDQKFGSMIWDTEYVLKGQAYDVTLGKENKDTSKSNERTGFLHFVREEDKRCPRDHTCFAEYIKKSGLFDREEEYKMAKDFGYKDQPQFKLPGSEKYARRPTMLGDSQTTGFANPLVRAPSFTGITRGPRSEEKSEVNHDDLNDQVQKQLNNLREAPAPKRKHDERLTLGDEIRQKLKKRGEFKEPESKAPTKSAEPEWMSVKLRETTPKSKSQPEDKHKLKMEKIQKILASNGSSPDNRRLRRRLYASELSL